MGALVKVELSGFKSFARKGVFEFSSPITAIVGPNGSGKSNVAESFRFVLGEQSIKSLRGKKGEDLIWGGSATSARSNRASVKVVFDNRDKLFNVDFDEVVIERVVHRDGVNSYHLNGTHVRLRDIIELLAVANIGATGHHIISQGEADRVLSAHMRERREMILDALGLKIYQYKKHESERKLEKTTENIEQVAAIRKEITPHLKFLTRQVEKVKKHAKIRDELSDLYREYLKRENEYLSYHDENLVSKKKGPELELSRLGKELVVAKEVLSKSDDDSGTKEKILKLEQKLSSVRREKDNLTRTLGRIEGKMAFEEESASEKEKKDEGRTVTFSEIQNLERRVNEAGSKVQGEQNIETVKNIVQTVVSMITLFVSERAHTESGAHTDTEDNLKKLIGEKNTHEERHKSLLNEETELEKEYTELQKGIEKVRGEGRKAERDVFSIMSRQNELRSEMSLVEQEENNIKRSRVDFDREIREGVSLIGRDILGYETHSVSDTSGKPVTREVIISEKREVQEDRKRKLERMKIRLDELGGSASEEIMKEHKEVSERDEFLEREVADLEKTADSLKGLIKELDEKLNTQFREGIGKINKEFQHFFSLMFGGGTAVLEVVKEKKRRVSDEEESSQDEQEEVEEGVDITVNLPRKKIKGLVMLSGGERALTSIALIFAMSQVNPPPFLVLDETDAALDEANSRRYGDMIEDLSKKSQLVLITHNRETMSRAGILYGVTMGSDSASKLLSVKFEEAVQVAK
jgi:chromosome segregation protein|tara:strand:- start:21726 stop:23981 length:2256 start_codon:yes stop_codon:yes gene_type:complete